MVETRSPKGEEQAQDPSPVVIGGCFLQCRYSGINFCPTYFCVVILNDFGFLVQDKMYCIA